jgi:hypothetical protein
VDESKIVFTADGKTETIGFEVGAFNQTLV